MDLLDIFFKDYPTLDFLNIFSNNNPPINQDTKNKKLKVFEKYFKKSKISDQEVIEKNFKINRKIS